MGGREHRAGGTRREPGGNGEGTGRGRRQLLVVELQVHPIVDLIWTVELRRKAIGGAGESAATAPPAPLKPLNTRPQKDTVAQRDVILEDRVPAGTGHTGSGGR